MHSSQLLEAGPLNRLLDPQSIVVIGASSNPAKRGHQAIRALQSAGYPHPVHAVNPRGGDVLGVAVTPSVRDLPYGVDVALICLPAAASAVAIRECGERGVFGAVLVASGFGESGESGAAAERDLRLAIRDTGIRVIGPNTSGILNAHTGANLVGLSNVPRGPVSVITQSGNMLLSLVEGSRASHGPGFHTCIGLGNQLDVRLHECVDHLARQPGTTSIAIHSEGIQDGRALLVAARRVTEHCPVVMLRGARSVVGQQVALSHTGSIAGSDAVAMAVLAQAGVELVSRSDELAAVANALATTPVPKAGGKVVVLSDGGGHAALTADALAALGVDLQPLSTPTQQRLRDALGPQSVTDNPIDVAGATDDNPLVFADAMDVLTADPDVALVLVVGLFGGYHLRFDNRLAAAENETAHRFIAAHDNTGTPVVLQSLYEPHGVSSHDVLRVGGVPVLESIDQAARVTAALIRRGALLASSHRRSDLRLPVASTRALPGLTGVLDEVEARRILGDSGIDLGAWELASTSEAAVEAVRRFGCPCAMKIVSADIVHKSDSGGVRLDVTPQTAADSFHEVVAAVRLAEPAAHVRGVLVTPMRGGVELLVGARRDPIFGPIVAFGWGGVTVEVMHDVAFRAAPFTATEAEEMIDETKVAQLLLGHRGAAAIDRSALARLLVDLGDVAATNPRIAELDLNPVIANDQGLFPVDVRIILSQEQPT